MRDDASVIEWVRGLSLRGEFAVVILAAFGLSLAGSFLVLMAPEHWLQGVPPITNARLLRTIIFELILGSLLWQFLALRSWTPAQVGLPSVRPPARKFLTTPMVALGLALAAYAGYATLAVLAANVWPEVVRRALEHRLVAQHLPIATVLGAALVNPVFEEVFVCGYVISALHDRFGAATAINVSAAIRLAYHLYQGATAVLSITPFALIAAIWFARTRRLTPLLLAHALMDFVGLRLAA